MRALRTTPSAPRVATRGRSPEALPRNSTHGSTSTANPQVTVPALTPIRPVPVPPGPDPTPASTPAPTHHELPRGVPAALYERPRLRLQVAYLAELGVYLRREVVPQRSLGLDGAVQPVLGVQGQVRGEREGQSQSQGQGKQGQAAWDLRSIAERPKSQNTTAVLRGGGLRGGCLWDGGDKVLCAGVQVLAHQDSGIAETNLGEWRGCCMRGYMVPCALSWLPPHVPAAHPTLRSPDWA